MAVYLKKKITKFTLGESICSVRASRLKPEPFSTVCILS